MEMRNREIKDEDEENEEEQMEILTKAEDDEPSQGYSRETTGSPPKLSPANVNEPSPSPEPSPEPSPPPKLETPSESPPNTPPITPIVNEETPPNGSSVEKKTRKRMAGGNKKMVYREKKNRLIDHNAPKHSKCAYVQFIMQRRPIYGNDKKMSQRDINITIAADWKKLTDEEKEPYEKLAAADKERSAREWAEYEKTAEHAEFQRQKAIFVRNGKNGRKRKAPANDDSDEEEGSTAGTSRGPFPGAASFCPLMRDSAAKPSTSKYEGPVFSEEFVAYNKARDSYRRQLQMERADLDYELETLQEHDLEEKIEQQEKRKKSLDAKIAQMLKTMKETLGTVPSANGHLDDIESLTEWLKSIGTKSTIKKSVRDAILKNC